MKNPFEKEHNSALIGSVLAGAVVAGTIAYLYLTESGEEARESFVYKVKDLAKDMAAGYISGKTNISKPALKKAADHFIK